MKHDNSYRDKNTNQKSVKFIHASDIHLGAAQYRNEYRSDDYIRAFQEILYLGINHNINFFIIGGDIFTSLEMLPRILTKIITILKDFIECTKNNIPIIAIEGNHDIRKFARGNKLPQRGQSWLKLIASLGLIILPYRVIELFTNEFIQAYNFRLKNGGKIQIKDVILYGNRYT